jgi:hypothetical protein
MQSRGSHIGRVGRGKLGRAWDGDTGRQGEDGRKSDVRWACRGMQDEASSHNEASK